MRDAGTTKPKYSYDEECANLAAYFLPHGTESRINELAQAIQGAVENWFESKEPDRG